MFTKKLVSTITVLVLCVSLFFTGIFYMSPIKADAFNGHYYGYGDSIMRTTPYADASDNFVLYMQTTYDAGNSSSRNTDGGGDTSNMGVDEFSSHVTNMGWGVIEQFGVNDFFYAGQNDAQGQPCSASILAQNKMQMYNYSVENGSHHHYYPCLFTLASPAYTSIGNSTQLIFLNTSMETMKKFSVRYIPLFDAIDTVPWNGRIDNWDSNHYVDNVHPSATGHHLMAELVWYFIQGWDFNETYFAGNNTLFVDADYNQTIYINNSFYGFDTDRLTVAFANNNTVVSHSIHTAIYGSEMIHFDVVKGNRYILTDDSFAFQSINDLTNNSITYEPISRFNWTKDNDAIYYQLQIANDSGFTDVFINLIDVNATNYVGNYTETGGYVEFTLPENYRRSWFQNYYMRVRPWYYYDG